jgi:Reverse transcriptase (RNA-dependent DNA polymerase)
MASKMFKVVAKSDVPIGSRIYNTRWVDTLKNTTNGITEKSRSVAQNYRDQGAASMPTKAPTVSRVAQRIAVALAASLPGNSEYVRDVSQAYTQAKTNLERAVYLRHPPEMGLPENNVLHCLKPLYGKPESGLHWFMTYLHHHRTELGMNQARADKCFLYRRDDGGISVTTLQVDDSFGTGTPEFLQDEEKHSLEFRCKPRQLIKTGGHVMFNGSEI